MGRFRLDSERQTGRVHLATGGAEGASQATEARTAVAERQFVHPASTGIPKPCLALRLRRGSHAQRQENPHAQCDQRVHAGMHRHWGREKAEGRRCHRRAFRIFILRGIPTHTRSDNGPEFIAKALREWIAAVGAKTACIMPGSPWENGYCESFNSKLRYELLNGEIFYTLKEAKIIIENWRQHYNTVRPYSSLGYKPSAPEAVVWPQQSRPASTPVVARRPTMH